MNGTEEVVLRERLRERRHGGEHFLPCVRHEDESDFRTARAERLQKIPRVATREMVVDQREVDLSRSREVEGRVRRRSREDDVAFALEHEPNRFSNALVPI